MSEWSAISKNVVRVGPNKRGHVSKDLKKSMRGHVGFWKKYIPGSRTASVKATSQGPPVKTWSRTSREVSLIEADWPKERKSRNEVRVKEECQIVQGYTD